MRKKLRQNSATKILSQNFVASCKNVGCDKFQNLEFCRKSGNQRVRENVELGGEKGCARSFLGPV